MATDLTDSAYPQVHITMRTLPEAERPREKLKMRGKKEMSNAELLAILIGSGSFEENAVQLAHRLLKGFNDDLSSLSKASIKDLCRFKGVGPAKASLISAALELGQRRSELKITVRTQIKSSVDAYELFKPVMVDLQVEEFWIILLNRSNKVIGRERISIGGVSGTMVDPKIIFRHALENFASYIILGHNHPSGNLAASDADLNLTKRLMSCGNDLDVKIIDHIIYTDAGYLSFADAGILM
jgi:DNA repair protein RadC